MSINNITTEILTELKNLLSSETIIGKPTQVGESIVMPLMKVSIGFGGGGGEPKNAKATKAASGGGGGGGMTVVPVAVLTITNGKAECFSVPQQQGQLSNILEKIPDFLSSFKKDDKKD